jgi:hypothetical protein
MNVETAALVNIHSFKFIQKHKSLINLYQTFDTSKYWTNEFGAIAGAKPASNRGVFLKVPRIPIGTKVNLGLPIELGETSPITGFGVNVVRLNNTRIWWGEHVFQAVKLDLHSEGALSQIVEHGILVFEPDDEPVGGRHPLAFLPGRNSEPTRKYIRARQPTMPKNNSFNYKPHFI